MSSVLWRDLSPEAKEDCSLRFHRLRRKDIGALNADEFMLFAQWLCKEHSGASAKTMKPCADGFDFALQQPNGDNEFLRVYSEQGQAAAFTLYELLETLRGSSIKRIHIYQRHPLSGDAQRMRREFPLAFEVLDMDGLIGRLSDVQRAAARGRGAMLPIAKKRAPIRLPKFLMRDDLESADTSKAIEPVVISPQSTVPNVIHQRRLTPERHNQLEPPLGSKRKPKRKSGRVWIETALVVAVVIMFWMFIGLLALMAFENAARG